MSFKDDFEEVLKQRIFWIPSFTTESVKPEGQFVATNKQMQAEARIKFDSYRRVDKPGSLIDFVIKKGASELWIGLWGNQVVTDDQIDAIEKSDISFVAVMEYIAVNDIKSSVQSGSVPHRMGLQQTTFWVNHKKHGLCYDKEKRVIRV